MTAILLERETNNYWNLIKDAGNEVKLALIKRLSDALTPASFAQAVDVGKQVDDDTCVEHQSHGRIIFCPSL